MRKCSALDALFPGVRAKVVALTFRSAERWWYLSELADEIGVRPSSIQREVARFCECGIFETRKDGRRNLFRPAWPAQVTEGVKLIVQATTGVSALVEGALRPLNDSITIAALFGSEASGTARPDSDIDLLIVGDVGLADIAPLLRPVERTLRRNINPVVLSSSELAQKLASSSHFVSNVIKGPLVFLKGSHDDLA